MKIRAAIEATLINFVVCVLLLAIFSATAVNLQNDIIEEELKLTCRLSTEMLGSAAFQDVREDYLSGIADEGGMLIAYFEADNSVAYQSFDYTAVPPSPSEMRRDAVGVCVFERTNPGRARLICAGMTLPDGSVLCFGKPAGTFMTSLAGYGWAYIMIITAAIVVQFIIIYRAVGLSDSMVSSIMGVLEDFTEGHFDSRITNVAAASQRVAAKYNATLARVQDRVFRQQRRNLVFGQMINQMRNGLITVDRDLNVNYATNMTGSLLGADVSDSAEKSLMSVFANEDLEAALKEAMESGKGNVCTADIEGKREDGSVRPLRVYASALFREGKTTGAMAVIEDITELRKLEQIRTDFAANVSHEMKTPLTSIKGFIETLQAGAIDNPAMARKFLDIILNEAERLNRLINDILSITKLESGAENVEITRLALDRTVAEVCMSLKKQAELKQVSVKFFPEEEHTYIMGNPDRVKQIAINLIENAIKYNKTGGTVTAKIMKDASNVYFSVSDTGIGIPEEHIKRLFERFYRVDKGRSRDMGGTGLGLAIVKHIVNTMKGTIEVSSKYGEGSEFLVTIPRAPEEEVIPIPNENTGGDWS